MQLSQVSNEMDERTARINHDKSLQYKIEKLMGKQQQKLKLVSQKKEQLFSKKIAELKKLDTFVDLEKQLKELNLLSNPTVQQQILLLKARQQHLADIKAFQESKEKQQNMIIEISKELQLDMNDINEEDDDYSELEYKLDLQKSNSTIKQRQRAIQNQQSLLQTGKLLRKVKDKISSKLSKSNPNLNLQFDFSTQCIEIPESLKFYKKVEEQIKFEEQLNSLQFKEKREDSELENKYQIIETFLSERGIQISGKEEIPHQKYLQDYHHRSSKLIHDAQIQALKILDHKKSSFCSDQNHTRKSSQFSHSSFRSNTPRNQEFNSPKDAILEQNGSQKAIIVRNKQKIKVDNQYYVNREIKRHLPKVKSFPKISIPKYIQQTNKKITDLLHKVTVTKTFFDIEKEQNDQLLDSMKDIIQNSLNKYSQEKFKSQIHRDEIDDFIKRLEICKFQKKPKKENIKKKIRLSKIFQQDYLKIKSD